MGLLHYFVQLHEDRPLLGNEDSEETVWETTICKETHNSGRRGRSPLSLLETPRHPRKGQAKIAHAKAGLIPFRDRGGCLFFQ